MFFLKYTTCAQGQSESFVKACDQPRGGGPSLTECLFRHNCVEPCLSSFRAQANNVRVTGNMD